MKRLFRASSPATRIDLLVSLDGTRIGDPSLCSKLCEFETSLRRWSLEMSEPASRVSLGPTLDSPNRLLRDVRVFQLCVYDSVFKDRGSREFGFLGRISRFCLRQMGSRTLVRRSDFVNDFLSKIVNVVARPGSPRFRRSARFFNQQGKSAQTRARPESFPPLVLNRRRPRQKPRARSVCFPSLATKP